MRILVLPAGVALVLGFPWGAGADPSPEEGPKRKAEEPRPGLLVDALRKAGELRCPVVVIVVPDDAPDREALALCLEGIAGLPRSPNPGPVMEAVFVCLPARVSRAGPGENAVLLDAEGKRLDGDRVHYTTCETFSKGMRALLDAQGRREARAAAQRTEKVAAALERLSSDVYAIREDGEKVLRELLPSCAAAVSAEAASTKDPEVRERCETLLREGARWLSPGGLPYGVAWETKRSARRHDPCPACGMASSEPEVLKRLKFLLP